MTFDGQRSPEAGLAAGRPYARTPEKKMRTGSTISHCADVVGTCEHSTDAGAPGPRRLSAAWYARAYFRVVDIFPPLSSASYDLLLHFRDPCMAALRSR